MVTTGMPATQVDGPKPILVLGKARQLMDAFTVERPRLTLSEIRQATALPSTTCARLARDLTRHGLLARDGDRYRVGTSVLRWSAAALQALDLVSVLTPLLVDLRDATGETAALYVRQEMLRTCVAVVPTRHPVIWQLRVGLSTPLHVGSGGRALLAFDEDATREALAGELARFTAHTITQAGKLRAVLADTRRRGVAVSHCELDLGVAGVSAPVFGVAEVIASLGVAGPSQRFGPGQVADYLRAVLAAAREASRLMGGQFPPQSGE
ncbi:MAG: IclR family transcriptional regulator [Mycobacteriales bacterium]